MANLLRSGSIKFSLNQDQGCGATAKITDVVTLQTVLDSTKPSLIPHGTCMFLVDFEGVKKLDFKKFDVSS